MKSHGPTAMLFARLRRNLPYCLPALLPLLAGCSPDIASPIDPPALAPPAGWLMAAKAPLPEIPAAEGNPKVRAGLYADMSGVCVARGRQVDGLQRWARTVTAQSHKQ